ncbi:MAG: hypothetical protein DRJ07_01430 [Bacteroidetes bacterium]|nr:MAG: hypothetical protein DRJ07_01430 [Bacteroidota bacterium]
MKYILALLLSIPFFISCSDDEGPQNFLERYDNSVWEINFDGVPLVYNKFHNNESNPIVEWHKNVNLNCFYFFSIENAGGGLIEVSNNRIIIEIPHPGTTNDYRNLTFTENGNTINLKVEVFENGISKSVVNYVLNRSSFKPQNVQICNNN